MTGDEKHSEHSATQSISPEKKTSLRKLIFRQYARSALFVILTIEVMLLAMYFGTNAYISHRTQQSLRVEAESILSRVALLSKDVISEILSSIEDKTRFFAESHVRLFAHPEAFEIEGEKPAIEPTPDGTGSLYQSNITDGSSFYAPASTSSKMGEKQWLFATNSVALNPLYRQVVKDHVVAAYVNVDEPADMNRLYPFIADVWKQYPPDLDMKNYNFFYLADARHNPEREVRWTGLYVDPAGQGWMFSCIAPVYVGDKLEAVVGLDVTLNKIAERIEKMELPWGAAAMLVSGKPDKKSSGEQQSHADKSASTTAHESQPGTVLAATRGESGAWSLLGFQEPQGQYDYNKEGRVEKDRLAELSILNLQDKALEHGLAAMFENPSATPREIESREGPLLAVNALIPSTGWQFFVIVRQSQVYAVVNALGHLSRLIGWAAVAVMALFYAIFFLWLRERSRHMAHEIAKPLEKLSRATANISDDGRDIEIRDTGIQEIDQLGDNFKKMSTSLSKRSMELLRESAVARELAQTASGNLHNVGNAVTRMSSSLVDLENVIKSTDQYPEAFRRIRSGDAAGMEVLRRFEEVLIGKTVPALKSVAKSIEDIKKAINKAIFDQQTGFRTAMNRMHENVQLSILLDEICADFRKMHPYIVFETAIERGIVIRGHREPLVHGIDNIIRNAVQASSPGSRIHIVCVEAPHGALMRVTDEGQGIDAEQLAKVGSPNFTTKLGGHGLGLSSFKKFLAENGGRLVVKSAGPGKGTEVILEVRNADDNYPGD